MLFAGLMLLVALATGQFIPLMIQLAWIIGGIVGIILAYRLIVLIAKIGWLQGLPIVGDTLRVIGKSIASVWRVSRPLSLIQIEEVKDVVVAGSVPPPKGHYLITSNTYPPGWGRLAKQLELKFGLVHETDSTGAEVRFLKYVNAVPQIKGERVNVPRYLMPAFLNKMRYEYKKKYSTLDYLGPAASVVTLQDILRKLTDDEQSIYHQFCFENN